MEFSMSEISSMLIDNFYQNILADRDNFVPIDSNQVEEKTD
jgi:hypothetical protein